MSIFQSWEEMKREADRQEEQKKLAFKNRNLASVDKSGICLNPDGYFFNLDGSSSYFIDADRLRTPQEVLQWLAHLGEKEWFTPQMQADFLTCCQKFIDFHTGESKKK